MEIIASIWNFVKSMGGPRGLGLLLLLCLICAFVVYQFSRGGSEDVADGNGDQRKGKLANFLIGGLGMLLVLGFLAVVILFVYLIFLN